MLLLIFDQNSSARGTALGRIPWFFLVSQVKLVGYSSESLCSMYTQIDIQGGSSNHLNKGLLLQTQNQDKFTIWRL